MLLIQRRQPAARHLLVGLVGQRHAVLGIFFGFVSIWFWSVRNRAIQVPELLVHDREILFHLPDVVLQDAMGSSSINSPVRKRMTLWKMSFPSVKTRLSVTMKISSRIAPIRIARCNVSVAARDQERKNPHESIRPAAMPPRTSTTSRRFPSGRCQKFFKPCITGEPGVVAMASPYPKIVSNSLRCC